MKSSITPNERLQLIGLLALAERSNREAEQIEKAAKALLEVPSDDFGHLSDAVYSSKPTDIDVLLERLKIAVTE